MRKNGYSLVEILITLMIGGVIAYFVSQGIRTFVTNKKVVTAHEDADWSLIEAVHLIQKVGRVSESCAKNVAAGVTDLRCRIDFTKPATGTMTWVRFYQSADNLIYERDDTGVGDFAGSKTVLQRFGPLDTFIICNDTDMNLAAGGTCPIQPTTLSQQHANMLGPFSFRPNRYYRFQLVEKLVVEGQTFKPSFQGAFYVRNPAIAWAPVGVKYSW